LLFAAHRFPARPERTSFDRIASRVNQELIAGSAEGEKSKQIINFPELLFLIEPRGFKLSLRNDFIDDCRPPTGFAPFSVGSLSPDKQKLSRIAKKLDFSIQCLAMY
jgi:hypothetical protein